METRSFAKANSHTLLPSTLCVPNPWPPWTSSNPLYSKPTFPFQFLSGITISEEGIFATTLWCMSLKDHLSASVRPNWGLRSLNRDEGVVSFSYIEPDKDKPVRKKRWMLKTFSIHFSASKNPAPPWPLSLRLQKNLYKFFPLMSLVWFAEVQPAHLCSWIPQRSTILVSAQYLEYKLIDFTKFYICIYI